MVEAMRCLQLRGSAPNGSAVPRQAGAAELLTAMNSDEGQLQALQHQVPPPLSVLMPRGRMRCTWAASMVHLLPAQQVVACGALPTATPVCVNVSPCAPRQQALHATACSSSPNNRR